MAEDDRGERSNRPTGKHDNRAGDTDGAAREGDKQVEGTPAQIPLLVDIADVPRPARVRKRRTRKENLSLDLDPEPPTTLDLFAEPGADHPEQARQTQQSAPDPVPDPADTALEAEMEARFREQAGELVDNLVQQYSQEILQRLREELGALLADLESDHKPSAYRRPGKDDPTD